MPPFFGLFPGSKISYQGDFWLKIAFGVADLFTKYGLLYISFFDKKKLSKFTAS